MGDDFRQSIDPLWFRFVFISMRYYTALFWTAIALGYALFRWQARRGTYPDGIERTMLLLGIPATVIGARLGHCLFYETAYYLRHPLEMLIFWRGGLASHGALVTLAITLSVVALVYHRSVIDLMDRFSFSAAVGIILVRLGNFLNSEIVGRETTVPWGVRFIRYDAGAQLRHPSQLYEMAIGLVCFGLLLWLDRKLGRERRPRGMLAGVFLMLYFGVRFFIEFTKAFQRSMGSSCLTMGQYLSILPAVIGLFLVVRAARRLSMDS
jgi:phosphatidylglycerol:prolipoprotein diacylglycerol transferase